MLMDQDNGLSDTLRSLEASQIGYIAENLGFEIDHIKKVVFQLPINQSNDYTVINVIVDHEYRSTGIKCRSIIKYEFNSNANKFSILKCNFGLNPRSYLLVNIDCRELINNQMIGKRLAHYSINLDNVDLFLPIITDLIHLTKAPQLIADIKSGNYFLQYIQRG